MSMQTRFIEPLDTLNFRGNKSFGEGGEHGESQMPPHPSIFSGALRSNWLAQQSVDVSRFQRGDNSQLPEPARAQLGTPVNPGSFRLQRLCLGRKRLDTGSIEILSPLPADVAVLQDSSYYLKPQVLSDALQSSAATPMHAVLMAGADKPETGLWLTQAGLQAYLRGEMLTSKMLRNSSELWGLDERLGIALDAASRSAESGRLYTTEAIAMFEDVGFVLAIAGADDLPQTGNLRLGGDGRGADMQPVCIDWPQPDWAQIEQTKSFRLVLTTAGLFERGWQLPGVADLEVELGDGHASLACAAVPRYEVISGWDLANWRPKNAQRLAPAGSVYWLKNYSGSIASLQQLTETGIGVDTLTSSRRAEGFNNIMIANWLD